MENVATRIAKPSGSIQLDQLNEIIAQRPELKPMPDRQVANPFTIESMIASGAGKAFYLEKDKPIGNLSLEDGEVLTTGIPRPICEGLALHLGADVYDIDFS